MIIHKLGNSNNSNFKQWIRVIIDNNNKLDKLIMINRNSSNKIMIDKTCFTIITTLVIHSQLQLNFQRNHSKFTLRNCKKKLRLQ